MFKNNFGKNKSGKQKKIQGKKGKKLENRLELNYEKSVTRLYLLGILADNKPQFSD